MWLSWSRQRQHASHKKDAHDPSFPGTTIRAKKRPLAQKENDVEVSNLLLAIAHPDDESMFFLPTLLHLRDTSQDDGSCGRVVIHVLCLSTGNAAGLGEVRSRELVAACALAGIPQDRVHIVDRPDMQDGMDKVWPSKGVEEVLRRTIRQHSITHVLTFDDYGVSGHPNHMAVHRGALSLLASSSAHAPVTLWVLESTSLLRKYLGLLDVPFSVLSSTRRVMNTDGDVGANGLQALDPVLIVRLTPWESWRAMATHASQWVWYRRLFVLFSRYTYINTIYRVGTGPGELDAEGINGTDASKKER